MRSVARKEPAVLQSAAPPPKLNWLHRFLGRAYFSKVAFDEESTETIRSAARRGTVVYVMRDRSYLDMLFFNWAYLERGLPLAMFANGLGSLLLHPIRVLFRWLFGRGRGRSGRGLIQTVARGESALLFLRKPQTLTERDPEFRANYVLDLIRLQRQRERPILLIPQLLLWSREPTRLEKSLIDLVFGEPEAPGRIRGVWLFLNNYRRAFAKIGKPLDLKEFLARFPDQSDERLAKKVRWMLRHYLARERQVVLGPILKAPRRVRAEVLRSREVRSAIALVASSQGRPEAEVERRARKLLAEIAADLNIRAVRAYCRFLSLVYSRIYAGIDIDEEGLARVREAMRRGPVVFVPSHRSHVDYLLVSHMIFYRGLIPPHIAAGKNLSFWPLGWIFRKGGAFFMRRSFKGDPLYLAVFRAYLQKLLREGFSVEFFIEGGRSRTGKMLFPKMGLLAMIVEAFLDGKVRDLALVPVHITYEKIIEVDSYSRELLGASKEKESLKGLLTVPKVLRSRYGRVYLDFAEPVSLSAFVAARGQPGGGTGEAESRRDLVRALAMRLTYDITRVARAAPSALAALALLGGGRRGTARERFLEVTHWLRDLLRVKHARLSKALRGPSITHSMDEAIRLFEGSGAIEVANQEDVIVYLVPEQARLQLDYYKNGILHAFVAEAIVACALLGEVGPAVPRVRVRDRARKLSRLLKYEFIFRPGVAFDELFDDACRNLERLGMLQAEEGMLRPVPERRADVRLLAGLVEHFIEAYAMAAQGLRLLRGGPLSERVLLQRILSASRRAFLTGDLRRFEACSKLIFENALRYLRDEGVLAEVPAEDETDRGGVTLAPRFHENGSLVSLEEGIRSLLPRPEV
jgi:glycerol-3-phosphate O-acyltransferase